MGSILINDRTVNVHELTRVIVACNHTVNIHGVKKLDATALQRQKRRIERLKTQGVTRSTVLVHENCREALDALRPHFVNPDEVDNLSKFIASINLDKKPINVSQVKHLSPFRYPGGKTWLVPKVRQWIADSKQRPSIFVEPFAGGAIAGLSVAAENLADSVYLSELDEDVAAVWATIFDGTESEVAFLKNRIVKFEVSIQNVRAILDGNPRSNKTRAFRTIVKNRMQRGGIMAAGAGLVKNGEAGRGLSSRWYADTLEKRISALRSIKNTIHFEKGDAFEAIQLFSKNSTAFYFIDPPYTAGGKKAGSRLYTHNEIDHERLFKMMAQVSGSVMMTYDDSTEVRELANLHGFRIELIPMKNTHHAIINELLILKP